MAIPECRGLIVDDGWNNLRNDINGAVGFEFRMTISRIATHLGMWDDHNKDAPVRPPRDVPTEFDCDRPSLTGEKSRGINASHLITLYELDNDRVVRVLGEVQVTSKSPGHLEGEFRYVPLPEPVKLENGTTYLLTMSTRAQDGDQFQDPVSFDGLSPLFSQSVEIVRAILARNDDLKGQGAIPAFSDMSEDYSRFRAPVGPTLKFRIYGQVQNIGP